MPRADRLRVRGLPRIRLHPRARGADPVTGYGVHPNRRRDPEPEHPDVWMWFVCHGPHGVNFDWKGHVPLLTEFIAERTDADPAFPAKARQIARECLGDEELVLVQKALCVLAVVGEEDLVRVAALVDDPDPAIASDATSCRFELERRRRRGRLGSA